MCASVAIASFYLCEKPGCGGCVFFGKAVHHAVLSSCKHGHDGGHDYLAAGPAGPLSSPKPSDTHHRCRRPSLSAAWINRARSAHWRNKSFMSKRVSQTHCAVRTGSRVLRKSPKPPTKCPFELTLGSLWVTLGCFGISLEPFGVTLGHFGIILINVGVILGSFWRSLGALSTPWTS